MTIIRTLIIAVIFIFTSNAVENLTISDEAQELLSQIRCITCTGQTVLGSDSDFAKSIKRFVIIELNAGKSSDQIKAELVSMYGDNILMTPNLSLKNLLLWAAPGILVVFIALLVIKRAVV